MTGWSNEVASPRPPRSRRQLASVALTAVAVLVVGVVAAAGVISALVPDWRPVSAMHALPEWNLPAYPGATLTGESENPRQPFWDWSDDTKEATVFHTYSVRADWEAVSAWYDTQLGPMGWRHPCPTCFDEWHRSGYDYRIWIFRSAPLAGGQSDIGFSAGISVGSYAEDWAPTRSLQSMPSAGVTPFPGSTTLSQQAWPRTSGTEAENASLQRRFGVNGASMSEVLAWYDAHLRALGWDPACPTCAAGGPGGRGQWMLWNAPETSPSGYEFLVAPEARVRLQPGEDRFQLVFSELLLEQ